MNVLMTGARAPVTLDLARHFARSGHDVFLADSIRLPLARFSSVIKKSFVVSQPAAGAERYVDDLVEIVKQNRIELLIPTCEEIYFIASRLNRFPLPLRVFCASLAELEPLHNKWSFAKLVGDLGDNVQSPETHLLINRESVCNWQLDRDCYEWVFKPVYSRFAARTLIAPSASQVDAITPSGADPWVAQRRIIGQEYSTYSIAIKGRVTAHACYRSDYRAGPGSGIYFVAIEQQAIQNFVERFVAKYCFTGQIGFDFMADATSPQSRVFVLECNPRATSGLHLLRGQSVANAFFAESPDSIRPVPGDRAMLASIMMLYALPHAIRQLHWKRFWQDMHQARDVIYDRRDLWPTMLSPLSLVEVIMTALKTGKPLTHAATFDIEWNGEPLT